MDIDALHSALLSIIVISKKLRSVRENLSVPDDRPSRLAKFLDKIERELHVTKATLVGELSFALCQSYWRPELVAPDFDTAVKCPSAGELLTNKRSGQTPNPSMKPTPPSVDVEALRL